MSRLTEKASDKGFIKVADGIERKTLVFGSHTLLTEFRLEKGRRVPMHRHPYEQTGYLISGHITLILNDERVDITPGDSWSIPEGMEHGVEVIERSVAVEVFSPVREDYLP